MDNKEYSTNQKKQKKSFKKYRKYIGRIFLWGGIALVSAAFFPVGVATALKGMLGDFLGGSASFFLQWGIAGAGAIGAAVNGIKANSERKKIEIAQDEEEDIVDRIINENDNLTKKVESYEKSINKEKDITESKVKTNGNYVRSSQIDDYEEEAEKTRSR